MNMSNLFIKLAKFFDEAKNEEKQHYADFMEFYETIVRTIPTSAVKEFWKAFSSGCRKWKSS